MDAFSAIYDYCSGLPAVTEDFPFDEEVLVFKVMGKIFALVNVNERPVRINLKCEPERAIRLREESDAVQPGYHMNKKHWNTVFVDGRLRWKSVSEMIDHSYEQVAAGLTRKQRSELELIASRAS